MKNSENMAVLGGHIKQLFTLYTDLTMQLLKIYRDFNITSGQVHIYFTWFDISWISWTN